MKFTRELNQTLTVHSVSSDGIRINDRLLLKTVVLTPEEVIETWQPASLDELSDADFEVLFKSTPELIIVGTGGTNIFPPRELMFAFARRGVGLEVMDTAAAARTFNVLAGEGRRVAAVLYPVA